MAITHEELKIGARIELFERNIKTHDGDWLPLRVVSKSKDRIKVKRDNGDTAWIYTHGLDIRYRLWTTGEAGF